EGAKLGDGHAKYGIVPAGGATVRLPGRIGVSRAGQLFTTASLVDAATLRDWGLVNEAVPKERRHERGRESAEDIRRCSPQVLSHIRWLTRPGSRDEQRQARLRAEIARFSQHLDGGDLAEGLRAFSEKRRPDFAGKA